MAQTEAEKKAATEKADAEKKAAADKAAADKAAAEKAAAEKKKKEDAKVGIDNDSIYSTSGVALTVLFVIAVLLENAFAVIFNWRVFLAYFSLRGIKTIIMILVSLAIVYAFDLDIVANLIAAYKTPKGGTLVDPTSGPMSKFITALILAGGSAGVNRIMNALGFRNDRREEDVVPKPPNKKAWIAVRVTGQAAKAKDIQVKIKEVPVAQVQNAPDPIAGVIGMKSARLSALLLRDANRFPQNGGYTVTPGLVYQITVEAKDAEDANAAPLKALGQQYVFAEGAIVDFEISQFS
jgi:hypothetical protein